jgi:glycosyltransferase involved in cell wall biosynthesis|tara:strand:- start:13485 stop:14435 length:951 start_codon:yes stop_codon:yes gene_type:complete
VDVSIISPVFNEKENLEPFIKQVSNVLSQELWTWELILVDDGSDDGSFDLLQKLSKSQKNLRIISLSKNFGQTSAIQAGFDNASGEYFVTLDSDLQNDPKDIPKLLHKLIYEDLDLVVGWRKDRKDNFLFRNLPSYIANKLIGAITGVKLNDYGCSLKAYNAKILREVKLYGEMHRFIPAWMATKVSAKKIDQLVVDHHPRIAGESKYGISRTFRVFLDLISVYFFMRFFSRPGHFFGFLGLLMTFVGVAILSYLIFIKFVYSMDIGDRPLLIAGTIFTVVGVQFISLGVIGEILSRTYYASSKEKSYLVKWDSKD